MGACKQVDADWVTEEVQWCASIVAGLEVEVDVGRNHHALPVLKDPVTAHMASPPPIPGITHPPCPPMPARKLLQVLHKFPFVLFLPGATGPFQMPVPD